MAGATAREAANKGCAATPQAKVGRGLTSLSWQGVLNECDAMAGCMIHAAKRFSTNFLVVSGGYLVNNTKCCMLIVVGAGLQPKKSDVAGAAGLSTGPIEKVGMLSPVVAP